MKNNFTDNPLLNYEGYKEEFKLLKTRIERNGNILNEQTLPFIAFITGQYLASVQINAANEIKNIINYGANSGIKKTVKTDFKSLLDWVKTIKSDKKHEQCVKLIEGRILGFYNQIFEAIGETPGNTSKKTKRDPETKVLKDYFEHETLNWNDIETELQTKTNEDNVPLVTKGNDNGLIWSNFRGSEQWLYSFVYDFFKNASNKNFKGLSAPKIKAIIRNTFHISSKLTHKGFGNQFATEPNAKYNLSFFKKEINP